jgi:hypothetical protein
LTGLQALPERMPLSHADSAPKSPAFSQASRKKRIISREASGPVASA